MFIHTLEVLHGNVYICRRILDMGVFAEVLENRLLLFLAQSFHKNTNVLTQLAACRFGCRKAPELCTTHGAEDECRRIANAWMHAEIVEDFRLLVLVQNLQSKQDLFVQLLARRLALRRSRSRFCPFVTALLAIRRGVAAYHK